MGNTGQVLKVSLAIFWLEHQHTSSTFQLQNYIIGLLHHNICIPTVEDLPFFSDAPCRNLLKMPSALKDFIQNLREQPEQMVNTRTQHIHTLKQKQRDSTR